MFHRVLATLALGAFALTAAACGSDAGARNDLGDVPAASCPAGETGCYEDGTNDAPDTPDVTDGAAGSACLVGDESCYETGGEGIAPGEPVPGMGMCAQDAPDCNDIELGSTDRCLPDAVGCEDTTGDEFRVDDARQLTQGFLGMNESDLPGDVRIGRRGEGIFALTEDYVLGRVTVELDDTDGSGYRVVTATVELPDGPETFELTPG